VQIAEAWILRQRFEDILGRQEAVAAFERLRQRIERAGVVARLRLDHRHEIAEDRVTRVGGDRRCDRRDR